MSTHWWHDDSSPERRNGMIPTTDELQAAHDDALRAALYADWPDPYEED